MKNAVLLVAIWAAIIAVASGYMLLQRVPEQQTFEFYSGGAYHVEGHGEWTVKLDTTGEFSLIHDVRGEVKDYGTFSLFDQERLELWRLIRGIAIEDLESSDRQGVPEEVQYRFVLRDDQQVHSVSMWVNDARQEEGIVALVEELAVLIEKLVGEKPVLY